MGVTSPAEDLEIRLLHLDDDAEVAQFLDVAQRSARLVDPGTTLPDVSTFRAARSEPHPTTPCVSWVGRRAGRVVAACDVWGAADGLPDADKVSVTIDVDPDLRHRGIGSAMLDALEREAEPRRPEMLSGCQFTGELDQAPGIAFARHHGWEVTSVSAMRHLDLPVDPARLDRLEPDTAPYRVEAFVDGIPESLRASWGQLVGLVDVDAPSGDIAWHATPLSPDDYARDLARSLAAGTRRIEAVATLDGEVVALTGMRAYRDPAVGVHISATYVRRDHRGHRLGLAVKIAALRALAALGTAHREIITANDEQNRHMIAINEQLGYRLVSRSAMLRKWRTPAS